jgi:uncharacterized protein (DUF4213/DUF364 family)
VIHGAINEIAHLVVIVRAVPPPQLKTMIFQGTKVTGITTNKSLDIFNVIFKLKIKDYDDFKNYIIEVGNSIGITTIQVNIKLHGTYFLI